MFITDATDEYLLEGKIRGFTPATMKSKTLEIRLFNKWLDYEHGITEIQKVSRLHVKQYISHCMDNGNKAVTINGKIKLIRPFYQYCVEENYCHHNPFTGIQRIKEEKPVFKVFSDDDVRKLLKALNNWSPQTYQGQKRIAMVTLLLDTGIRVIELMKLKVGDVHSNFILVHGKGNKVRTVPISFKLQKVLLRYERERTAYLNSIKSSNEFYFPAKNGKGISNSTTVWRIMQSASERAGISTDIRVSPHTCRHYYTIKSLELGTPIEQVSRNLGHESLRTTEIYLRQITSEQLIQYAKDNTRSPLSGL